MWPFTEKTSGIHLLLLLFISALPCNGKITRHLNNLANVLGQDLPGLHICGRPSRRDYIRSRRIISGTKAELGAHPWIALILNAPSIGKSTGVSWDCAGTLISDRYIITAAHCLTNFNIKGSRVRLGELDLDAGTDDKATPIDLEIEKIISHRFIRGKKINDIGLIKLKNRVTYTNHIIPMCLPPPEFQDQSFVGFSSTIAGWGQSVLGRTDTNTRLLEAEVQIKDTASCKANITSIYKTYVIDHRVLCASANHKDACKGDSGGPMLLAQKVKGSGSGSLGNYFLIGITSYGHNCAEEGYPGVYTRVTEYMNWILDHMDK